MSRTVPLFQSGQVTADANGVAMVAIGPKIAFETWEIRSISVSSTSVTLIPKASHYRGQQGPSRLINGTFSGNFDTDPDFNQRLENAEELVTVWENCDAGSICTVTVNGTKTVPF